MYKLEERILFDAALPVDVAESVDNPENVDILENDAEAVLESDENSGDVGQSTVVSEFFTEAEYIIDLPGLAELAENPFEVKSLVIIDTSVSDYETLISALEGTTEIKLIDSSKGGIEQISDILSQYDDLDSLHILSEGGEGHLVLGSDVLWQSNVDSFGDQLSLWNNSLSQDADILFYGCNTASSERGVDLLSSLADYTGVDVAGSNDLTGSAEQGGDWDFEFNTGSIAAESLSLTDYDGTFATITVDSKLDDNGVGTTLREAIVQANADTASDTIVFDAGVFTSGNATITLDGVNDIDITENLTITGLDFDGDGMGDIIIDADNGNRHLNIYGNVSSVTISNLNFINGSSSENGGSINNRATGAALTINNSEFSNNLATWPGGAIADYSGLDLTLNTVSIHNNQANGGEGGGGVYKQGAGSFTISDSIFYANVANHSGGEGGAISFDTTGAGGTFTMLRSTVSGNSSNGAGSGIWLDQVTTSTIKYSTISANSGGTASVYVDGGDLTIYSSIIVGNNSGVNELHVANIGTETYNYSWVGSTNSGNFTDGVNNNVVDSANTMVGLADNGGSTMTHAIKYGGVAHNTGATDGAEATVDQTGSSMVGQRDMGAYELNGVLVLPGSYNFTVTTLSDSGDDASGSLDYNDDLTDGAGLSLREAIFWSGYNSSQDTVITFDSGLSGGTVSLTSVLWITDDVTINGLDSDGDGVGDITVDGGNSYQIFNISDGDGGAADIVVLSNLVLTQGSSINGGAVAINTSSVTMNNCVVKNSSASDVGGGIYNLNGTLSLNTSSIHDNDATGDELHNWNLTGGGIYQEGGSLIIDDSAIYQNGNNITTNNGGGIAIYNATALTVTNSTFSGNQVSQYGSAITAVDTDVNLDHVTIADHTTGTAGVLTWQGNITISNSIILRNLNKDLEINNEVSESITNTWTEVVFGATIDAGSTTDVTNKAALGSLADNGGPTLTHAITNVTPAYNSAGSSAGSDQRGVTAQGVRDMGAFELDTTAPILNSNTPVDGSEVTFVNSKVITITYDEAIDSTNGSVTITDMGDLTATDDSVTINLSDTRISISGSTLTLTLAGELTGGERYQITTAGITDIAQNAATAINAGAIIYSVIPDPQSSTPITQDQLESNSPPSSISNSPTLSVPGQDQYLDPIVIESLSTEFGVTLFSKDPYLTHYVIPQLDMNVPGQDDQQKYLSHDNTIQFSVISSVIAQWQTRGHLEFSREEAEQFFHEFDQLFDANDPFDWGDDDEKRRHDGENMIDPSIILHDPQKRAPAFKSSFESALDVLRNVQL